jgi:GT2 family glycosyltransferase
MSVVISTPDTFEAIRKTVSHLREQTVRDSLEIVVVAASREKLAMDEGELSVFASHQVVELGEVASVAAANTAGVRHARAPIVAFAEDHCFPEPDWAERLIAAYDGPWVAVGPAVRNANPRTAVSWADLFIGYDPWLEPIEAHEVEFLPGHNSSYLREVLLAYGERLESMLDAETVLHWDLRAQGHRLFLESAARVAHTNFSLWSSWIPAQFFNGRLFAATRVRQMSAAKRWVYVLGSPLIPLVRLARVSSPRRSRALLGPYLRCLPVLVVGLMLDGIGQMLGYAFGVANAVEEVAKIEANRARHITEQDRMDIFGAS